MPFTPLHFGPGLLIKGLIPNQFSFSTFALANVAMDIEPLYRLWRGDVQLHGASHTVLGAGLIGAGVAMAGPAAIRRTWQWYARLHAAAGPEFRITRLQAWLGALLGTGSHVLLDAVMHRDVQPFMPLTAANPFLQAEWTQNLYLACVLAGMVGMLLILIRAGLQPARNF
ncbi:MAG TPA: metal-dependent hydrolase [Gallionellaceae bacterium]|nr:metal-dependent hydrolase [Gallionellaceae bacterium]